MSNPSHYQGNTLDLSSGGFQITTVNSVSEDFFMGMWCCILILMELVNSLVLILQETMFTLKHYPIVVKIRHVGDGGSTSSNTSLNDGLVVHYQELMTLFMDLLMEQQL